jgi:hypothetical protein
MYIFDHISSVLRIKNVSNKLLEKNETHFIFNNVPPPENRAVYEIMWTKYGRGRQVADEI